MQFDFSALAIGPDIAGLYLVALAVDALFGNAPGLRRLFPHPALIMAALIGGLAAKLNRPERGMVARLVRGGLVEAVVILLALAAGYGLEYLTQILPFFWIVTLFFLVSLTVLRGPFDEAGRVTLGYASGGLKEARLAAASVIGPTAASLNERQLNQALAQHLAGRFADGLVAGVFWLLILGLPGFLLWRAINISGRLLDDSQPEMAVFGLIASRMNEAFGLLPAWLAGIIICVAAIFVPGASPLKAIAAISGSGAGELRHSVRAAVAATAAALGNAGSMTGPDVVRAQYLYAIAGLLVFALVVVISALRYAI